VNASKVSVIVASRNRIQNLEELLRSIDLNSVLPLEVIVVTSGISYDLAALKNWKIKLIHNHVDFSGQVKQKAFGVDLISKDCDWVLFLDDDVLLPHDFFENLFKYDFDKRVLGVAFKHNISVSTNYINRIYTYLNHNKFGKIKKNGHPVSYNFSKNICQIKWANGISMWSSKIIYLYKLNPMAVSYSAFEDVIFSYKISKFGQILFLPDSIVLSQRKIEFPVSLDNYIASIFWRYYFVGTHKEFSMCLMFIDEIFRMIIFTLRGDSSISFVIRFKTALKQLVYLCKYISFKIDVNKVITNHALV
jgi:GT2 family glycosyltransferase